VSLRVSTSLSFWSLYSLTYLFSAKNASIDGPSAVTAWEA
jgi:hypothetical protein